MKLSVRVTSSHQMGPMGIVHFFNLDYYSFAHSGYN